MGDVATTSQSGIVMGYYSEVERFAKIEKELLVCPVGPGKFSISNKLQLIPDTLVGGAIIQAIAAPHTNSGVVYIILAQDNDAMNVVSKLLSDQTKADQIGGQACVITKDGRVIPLKLQGQDTAKEVKKIQQTYTPQMRWIMIALVVIVVGGLYWVGRQFVKKKPLVPQAFTDSEHARTENTDKPN